MGEAGPTSSTCRGSNRPKADYIQELERQADLGDRGIISAEDSEAKKKQLLGCKLHLQLPASFMMGVYP